MKLDRVVITGADDATNPMELVRLSEKYPFVEWGILFSISKIGQPRYPSTEWQHALFNAKASSDHPLGLSAHICGAYSRNMMEHSDFMIVNVLGESFQRFQVNYNFSQGHNWRLGPVIELARNLKKYDKALIFQMNKSNDYAVSKLTQTSIENIHILYDASGGRGKQIGVIDIPVDGHYTGYSGGLGPDNIESFLTQLHSFRIEIPVFIDMESAVRTEDKFDIEKVETVLEICSKFINQNTQ